MPFANKIDLKHEKGGLICHKSSASMRPHGHLSLDADAQ